MAPHHRLKLSALRPFLRPFWLATVGSLALLTGCTSRLAPSSAATQRPASSGDTLLVTVPHIEHLDVSFCEGSPVAINRVLSTRAESFARMIEHGSVWYGDGLSMEPLLKPGSWIVTRPHPYTELEPGMVDLYTASSGRPVAHALIRRTSRGWLAAGVNNRRADRDLVTSTNLAGVITAVFTAAN